MFVVKIPIPVTRFLFKTVQKAFLLGLQYYEGGLLLEGIIFHNFQHKLYDQDLGYTSPTIVN